jgi:ABC-type lipoprotein export system ATPase subunit
MKYLELKNKIINDKYTEYVYEAFDIQNKEETIVKIPINFAECKTFDWNIGVIYGGSGTGKTSLLKEFGSLIDDNFDNEKPLISNFDFLEPKEATLLLSAMGLSSVPTWLRPFALLSNGEQYRARLAYKVASAKDNQVILIDEFTSVVDRDVAKSMSSAIQKYIRRENKKIILASCHFDIMEWLLPDWTYSPLKGRVERHDYLRQSRPKIELQIFRCRYEAWNIFKQHHYLSEDLNEASKNFLVIWNNKPVAFFAFLPFPCGTLKNAWRGSRSVVLPDFQGLGIGYHVSKYLHSLFKKEGYRMYVKSSNPAIINSRLKDKDYKGGIASNKNNSNTNMNWNRKTNLAYSFEYIGEDSNDDTSIIKFKSEVYKDVAQNQIALF